MNSLAKEKNNILLLSAAAILLLKKKEKRKKRKWTRSWIAKRNEIVDKKKGANNIISLLKYELAAEDPYNYKNYMRMDEATFNKLLLMLKPFITRQNTILRQAIPPSDRLIACLRYLSTGETLQTLSLSMRMPHNTLSMVITQVLKAIVDNLGENYLKTPNTEEDWNDIATEFENCWNFPHCIGAMDGKHITFRPRRKDGSFYRNYKNTDSIVLLAVVDAHYRFLMVDIGRNGRLSDGGVFSRSPISTALEKNYLNIPPDSPLPDRIMKVPYVVVADDAFPLKENIMKPYRFHGLTNEQKIYNYRVSRARRLVESAFGILCNRFQIFLKHMNVSVEKVELITHASIILHNFLVKANKNYTDSEDINCNLNLRSIAEHSSGNRNSNRARNVRQEFQDYFNSNGALTWQQDCVDRHNL